MGKRKRSKLNKVFRHWRHARRCTAYFVLKFSALSKSKSFITCNAQIVAYVRHFSISPLFRRSGHFFGHHSPVGCCEGISDQKRVLPDLFKVTIVQVWPIAFVEPSKLQRTGKGKRLVIANGAEAEVNPGLVELIKEAFTIRIQLLSGSDDSSIEAMSGSLRMNKCRLTSLIRLSHLALEILGALLAGRHPIELTPTRLLRLSKNLPHDWNEQRRFLGFAA
jgi:hypothetical protein